MKKLFTICIIALSFISCATDENTPQTFANGEIIIKEITNSSNIGGDHYIVEVTFNGETHEYIKYYSGYRGGIGHWEGCKYCKEAREKRMEQLINEIEELKQLVAESQNQ